jgi:predicted nucleic acid-binding Zn ribbon protein
VESVITAPAIKFKGSGWYVTDYAGKTALGETPEKSDAGKGDKDGGEKAEAGEKSEKKESAKESSSKESGKESSGKSSTKESKDNKAAKKK